MGPEHCRICEKPALIAECLGICSSCIGERFGDALSHITAAHARSRAPFSLPTSVPRDRGGAVCSQCTNACRISEGGVGFCGVRSNINGEVGHVLGTDAIVQCYYDPLPTNCVAGWTCAATGRGYPRYSYDKGGEWGYRNLAVFYCACSFDCLYCQNWHYRRVLKERSAVLSPDALASMVDRRTACICYFGGDPTPQIDHALETSRTALERTTDRILRICWETNGSMSPALAEKAFELSLSSGGCMKFDLKAYSDNLHIALTGVSNKRTLGNFRRLAKRAGERDPPPLIASTLIVPGYVDAEEVRAIASFIASLNPEIPYALLAFHPDFMMMDLPTTSRNEAEAALSAATSAGLRNVRLGNVHLLG
ncbi:MAG: radical SAM protein [Candidatus Thermoplasmatota archaeon]